MQFEYLKPLLTWMHLHPNWTGVVVFLVAFTESIAFVGLFIPGSILLSIFGVLVGAGVLPLVSTMIYIILGAFAGDLLSYWLGYYYRSPIRELWPFRLATKWFIKGEELFKRHGGKAILLGRFIGPLRPLTPVLAGIMSLPPLYFISINIIAVLLWALVYIVPGILIGTASLALSPEMTTYIVIYMIVLLLILWLLYWAIKSLLRHMVSFYSSCIQKMWIWMRNEPCCINISKRMQVKYMPDDYHQLSIAILFSICLLLFCSLIGLVIVSHSLISTNIAIFHLMRTIFNPITQEIMVAMALFGDKYLIIALWLTVALWLTWQRYWIAVLHWILVGFLAFGLTGIIQRTVPSIRPPGLLHYLNSWSFPSGHTTSAVAFYGFAAVLIAMGQSFLTRYMAYMSAVILAVAVAISRLYLDAHWFTDIIGSTLLGLTIVLGVTFSYRRLAPPIIYSQGLIATALLTIILAWICLYIFSFNNMLSVYTPYRPMQSLSYSEWWNKGMEVEPLRLTNRFGILEQTVNIEWEGELPAIGDVLRKYGWQERPKDTFTKLLDGVGFKKTEGIIVQDWFFEDQKPVLVMTKKLNNVPGYLVLKLWNSYTILTESQHTIWVGTINYTSGPIKTSIFNLSNKHKNIEQIKVYPYVLIDNNLKPSLKNLTWRRHVFPLSWRLNTHADRFWDGRVMLVRVPSPELKQNNVNKSL